MMRPKIHLNLFLSSRIYFPVLTPQIIVEDSRESEKSEYLIILYKMVNWVL